MTGRGDSLRCMAFAAKHAMKGRDSSLHSGAKHAMREGLAPFIAQGKTCYESLHCMVWEQGTLPGKGVALHGFGAKQAIKGRSGRKLRSGPFKLPRSAEMGARSWKALGLACLTDVPDICEALYAQSA